MKRTVLMGAALAAGFALSACSVSDKGMELEPVVSKPAEAPAPTVAPPVAPAVDAEAKPAEPAVEEIAAWMAIPVEPGMAREDVDAKLGAPRQLSRTKDDQIYAMYEKADHWRSVVYDDQNKTVIAYP